MASKKDNKRLTAKTLIDKGKKQGSLTLSEIMELILLIFHLL